MTDLSNLEDLKQACADVLQVAQESEEYVRWGERLHDFLIYVRDADQEIRATEEFHWRIWEENPVSAVGMGTVSVEKAMKEADFRSWIAEISVKSLPEAGKARGAALRQLTTDIQEEIRKYTDRKPRLKIYRVLAAFFPHDFTTVVHAKRLRRLRLAMIGPQNDAGPMRHINVLSRLSEALGPTGEDLNAVVDRMRLPWLLYTHYVAPSDDEETESREPIPGSEKLVPLPAARRRRGLTGVRGGFPSVLNILEFCRDGVSRDDLKNHIRSINPNLKDSSINTSINVLVSEFNCLKWNGDHYLLTDRGDAVLESGDPNELMDWLVTRILAVDHALVILRDEGPSPVSEMLPNIQAVNPGWTTDWAPTIILDQLRGLGMLSRDENRILSLTETGQEWAGRIHWNPEILPSEEDTGVLIGKTATDFDETDAAIVLPEFSEIVRQVSEVGHFPEAGIRRLNSGLWAHHRRHFAVLTGLSGSGKTLLARAYGKAIAGAGEGAGKQVCTIPVQPGWYDPSSILGYVNPLQGDAFVRTPFLEFLLEAANAPTLPYTVILDEMNLSRPEQYLAPILSAMETGASLSLHREGEVFDGVPEDVRYPRNLVIIGTVNMDETTHGISDKVLDRAFTIEFWDIDLAAYPRWGERDLNGEQEKAARAVLEDLMECLRPARLHFGWRTVDDVLDYLNHVVSDGHGLEPTPILDSVVYAKILPKLRGDDSPRFREALEKCSEVLENHGLSDCRSKVLELRDDLESTGSARFWR